MDNKYPVPQANNIERMFDIFCNLPEEGGLHKEDVACAYNMDERQGDYYLGALAFLGLMTKEGDTYLKSHKGDFLLRFMEGESLRIKKKMFCVSIFQDALIQQVYDNWRKDGIGCLGMENICNLLVSEYNLNDTTAKRRAQSVLAWCNWIKNVMSDGKDKESVAKQNKNPDKDEDSYDADR